MGDSRTEGGRGRVGIWIFNWDPNRTVGEPGFDEFGPGWSSVRASMRPRERALAGQRFLISCLVLREEWGLKSRIEVGLMMDDSVSVRVLGMKLVNNLFELRNEKLGFL